MLTIDGELLLILGIFFAFCHGFHTGVSMPS